MEPFAWFAVGPPLTAIARTLEPFPDPVEVVVLLVLEPPPQPAAKARPISKIDGKTARTAKLLLNDH
jgi:hypothetical protein